MKFFLRVRGQWAWYGLICLLLLMLRFPALGQNTSNKGTDFWVVYTGHTDGTNSRMFLYLTSDVSTNATVSTGIMSTQTVQVTANEVTVVPIDGNLAYVATSEVVEKKGIHVTSERPIVVYSHIFISARSAATVVLPTNTLGREYYALAYARYQNTGLSEFTIIGVEDNTTIEITPKAQTLTILTHRGTQTNAHAPNVPFKIKLNKGEVYQVQSASDLTGSRIHTNVPENSTCKKIAVFSGDSWSALGCPVPNRAHVGGADNLYQQLYPVSSWGRTFITAPFINRPFDIFRILVPEDNTVITVNGSTTSANGTPLVNPYKKGDVIEFQSSTPNLISASAPVSVAQYAISMLCDTRNPNANNPPYPGDPEMIVLNPVEQTVSSSTLYSALRNQTSPATNITQHFINVVMKAADAPSFRLDGALPKAAFVPIPNTEYAFLQEDVTASSQVRPTHNLVAAGGFNAIAYGYGSYESYGYSAGANVRDLTRYITPQPAAGPAFTTGCESATVKFQVTLPYQPTAMVWEFGDGTTFRETDMSKRESPLHTYRNKGLYQVKLTVSKPVSNDCDVQDELTFDFEVFGNPKAGFSFADQCAKNPTVFKDLSTAASNTTLAKWEWEFEPGKKSTQQHPQYTFAKPGDYRVKLKVITNGGCEDTASQKITIHPLPQPAFKSAPVCETYASGFRDESTIAAGTITAWRWDFGDGSPVSTDRHPTHTYARSGTFQVKLMLTSDQGCRDSLTLPVTIYPKPKAAYQLPNICLKDVATFTNKSTITSGSLSYKWFFGDGGTATAANPTHKYTAEGVYQVKLVVTSDKGCKDSLTTAYLVSGAEPVPDFTASSFCRKDSVQFRDASTIAFGKVFKWKWDFGDGATATVQHPKHRYAQPGTYQVKMVAYSGEVCRDSVTRTITVIQSPDAAFTTANVCLGQATPLAESSAMPGGSLTAYAWNFGDGKSSNERLPVHTYAAPGTYTITLTITASNGCTDRLTRQIIIYPKPVPVFQATGFCEQDAVTFTDQSTLSSGRITGWQWAFGDGATSTQQHPRHTFPKPGTYAVKLTVSTDQGCTESLTQNITIQARPQADAGPDQLGLCGITTVALQAKVPAVGQGTWTIVGGTGGSLAGVNQPQALFSGKMNEVYTLRWTVRNAPCPDAADEVQVRFNPIPKVEAGVGAELVEGESFTLNGSGEGAYSWSPATGLSDPKISNPVASPVVTTVYKLTMTTPAGCTATDSVTIKVLAKIKIPNAFSPNNDGINDNWVIQGIGDYPRATIEVYDRWGGKVFAGGYNEPWDGRRNGQPLPMGTYFYIINQHNGRKTFAGPVSIIR